MVNLLVAMVMMMTMSPVWGSIDVAIAIATVAEVH